MTSSPSLSVIVPLYIYPLEKAWEPLFHAAKAHPNVRFLVIVNPHNGPGDSALPDASYAAALRELNAVCNIHVIGYVYCTYGNRPVDDIQRDIDVYLGWNDQFRVDGIFVDEAPSSSEKVTYMASLTEYTSKSWEGALGRRSINILNPGVVAHAAYFDSADFVVTFEQSAAHWNVEDVKNAIETLSPDHCPKSLVIIHTCDSDEEISDLVQQAKSKSLGGIYITEQVGGFFTKWPQAWDHFLDRVGTASG
ncbi:unnamed protein product [Clonostachys solani]|uniref:Spherulin-4 n=1 Tax=Clonostachys solani TaxID=160281 RepID=A0A9N9ZPN0_9HYPO|nr:unnamed protein product [Clonostachys solani]